MIGRRGAKSRRGALAADGSERLGGQGSQLRVLGRGQHAGEERDPLLGTGPAERPDLDAQLGVAGGGGLGPGRPAHQRVRAAGELERAGVDQRVDGPEHLVGRERCEDAVRAEPVVTRRDERPPARATQNLDDARATDASLGLVDGVQHRRRHVDVDRVHRRGRLGVGQAHDGRSAHVAAPIGRHARRCVREVPEERGPAAVAARRVGVDRREPVPPAPLDAAARDDRRGQMALRELGVGDPAGGRAGGRREELERTGPLEHGEGDTRLVDPQISLAHPEDAPVVGPLRDSRVHGGQVGRGQPRAVDEMDDEALVSPCIEERAARRQPVAAGAAGLLVVLLRRGRERPVDDRADVRLVDAHAEGGRRAHDIELPCEEGRQRGGSPGAVEPGVIRRRTQPAG